jgi:D-alanyl-D-alanine carboxypeptidase/D-alanyl-D-alanine-endopeptidase (penicillin-binding protein 4)
VKSTAPRRSLVFAFFLNNVLLDAPEGWLSEATAAAGRVLGRLCEVVYQHDAPAESKPKADGTPKAGD